jgi:hypothetical protein
MLKSNQRSNAHLCQTSTSRSTSETIISNNNVADVIGPHTAMDRVGPNNSNNISSRACAGTTVGTTCVDRATMCLPEDGVGEEAVEAAVAKTETPVLSTGGASMADHSSNHETTTTTIIIITARVKDGNSEATAETHVQLPPRAMDTNSMAELSRSADPKMVAALA